MTLTFFCKIKAFFTYNTNTTRFINDGENVTETWILFFFFFWDFHYFTFCEFQMASGVSGLCVANSAEVAVRRELVSAMVKGLSWMDFCIVHVQLNTSHVMWKNVSLYCINIILKSNKSMYFNNLNKHLTW